MLFNKFSRGTEIGKLLTEINIVIGTSGDPLAENENNAIRKMHDFLNKIHGVESADRFRGDWRGFFSNSLITIMDSLIPDFYSLKEDESKFFDHFEGKCQDSLLESLEFKDADIIIGRVSFPRGIDGKYCIRKSSNQELVRFLDYSNISIVLRDEKNLLPTFHLYANRDQLYSDSNKQAALVKFICEQMYQCVCESIKLFVSSCRDES